MPVQQTGFPVVLMRSNTEWFAVIANYFALAAKADPNSPAGCNQFAE
jgi:hypothetical protein